MYTEGHEQQNAAWEPGQNTVQQPAPRCANCDIEILWTPVVIGEKAYCCAGCAGGGPCNCDYSQYRSVKIAGVIHYGSN